MTLSRYMKNLSSEELDTIRYGLNFLCNRHNTRSSLDWVYEEDLDNISVKQARHALVMVMNDRECKIDERKEQARSAWPKLSNY